MHGDYYTQGSENAYGGNQHKETKQGHLDYF